jgi:hypothetical protein
MQNLPTIGLNADTIGMDPVPSTHNSLVPFPAVPSSNPIKDLTDAKVTNIQKGLEYDPVIQNLVSNKLAEKVVLDDVEFKYLVDGIDFYDELENFLAIRNSPATRTGYKHSIKEFVLWCRNQDIKPLEVKVSDVDRYQCLLIDSQYSNKTIRTRILGVSSFYTFLLYRYPKVMKVNPFNHRNLPRDTCKNPKDYITDKDVKALRKEFQRIGRKDMVCVLDLISKYGFRVGSFDTLHINKSGLYSLTSKGSDYIGKFTKKEHEQIIRFNVLDLTTSTVRNIIKKYVHKLYLADKVSCDFSVHDIRRYYINKNVDGCQNARELLAFSRSIHKNINTTIGYCS